MQERQLCRETRQTCPDTQTISPELARQPLLGGQKKPVVAARATRTVSKIATSSEWPPLETIR